MRAILPILVIAALVAVGVFFADRPGSVSLEWQGWRFDTSVALFGLAVIALAFLIIIVLRLGRLIVMGPRLFARARRERRRRAGYRALTQGMVAVAAGDPNEADRFARKADTLLADPPLTLLLSAQAAQLGGDDAAANRYFQAMLKRPETEFLGLRGLIVHALKDDDRETALRLARRAHELRPRTPWVLLSLYDLLARSGQWREAQATLIEAERAHALPAPEAQKHQAAVLYELSLDAKRDGRPRDSLAFAEEAVKADPLFVTAAAHLAELLAAEGKTRRATKLLEKTWEAAPHPRLAEIYAGLVRRETARERYRRMDRLRMVRPDDIESHIALAESAIAAELWGEARRHLEDAGAKSASPTARVCRLMARIEESEHGDGAAAREWLAKLATAQPDPAYVCKSCGMQTREWAALCPSCGAFDTLGWTTPRGAPPVMIMTERSRPAPALVEAAS